MTEKNEELEKLERRLESLENRLSLIESAYGERNGFLLSGSEKAILLAESAPEQATREDEDKGLESRIGRVGLAWLGIIVLLFGIIFLTEYLKTLDLKLLSAVTGYCSVIVINLLAVYLKKSNLSLSSMFKLIGQVILFYVTIRLHFFSASPQITSKALAVAFLLLVIAYQTFITIRNKSQTDGALTILFVMAAALLSDMPHLMLTLISIASIGSLYFYYKNNWEVLLSVTVLVSYLTFFLWLFGNPVVGHQMQLISDHNYGYIYLFVIGACYSLLPLLKRQDEYSDDFIATVLILNGILFTLFLTIVTVRFFSNGYVGLFTLISFSCLGWSIVLKSVSDRKFASAFFALYGFMAMSIALYGLVGLPELFLLLSVQSLVVVTMALWFRNRLIIVMNSLLFTTILFIYMTFSEKTDGASFAFALVSLISARIINWKKERLNIKTDLIRNLYLTEGFIMVLFALFHAVPRQFVTLSWTIAALLYFLLSFILKNVKYRYMALGTMISAAIYLFIVDLARIELIYRVLALLTLAIASIGISIFYTSQRKKNPK